VKGKLNNAYKLPPSEYSEVLHNVDKISFFTNLRFSKNSDFGVSVPRSWGKTNVMVGTCSAYGIEERRILEDPGIYRRIILRYIFRKWVGWAWIGLIWLRIGTGGGHM
jgi:hypothetical protein